MRDMRVLSHRLVKAIGIAAGAAGLAALASACGSSATAPAPERTAISPIIRVDPPVAIKDFELVDQRGETFRFSEDGRRARLFYFGYTSCPDICPATMVDWRAAKRDLGERASDVRFVMVTVDPPTDTPEVLGNYLLHFDDEFVGLSGSEEQLKRAWDAFGIEVKRLDLPESATQHSISHPASIFVVDDRDELVMKLAFDADPEDIVEGVTEVLEEEE
jgi:protein SCO1/2